MRINANSILLTQSDQSFGDGWPKNEENLKVGENYQNNETNDRKLKF